MIIIVIFKDYYYIVMFGWPISREGRSLRPLVEIENSSSLYFFCPWT